MYPLSDLYLIAQAFFFFTRHEEGLFWDFNMLADGKWKRVNARGGTRALSPANTVLSANPVHVVTNVACFRDVSKAAWRQRR
jgi:hypothetical protein